MVCRSRSRFLLALMAGLLPGVGIRCAAAETEPSYTIAFASFGPRNTDLFVADADGKNARPLVPHADNDYNASFSRDGEWIVFTSYRQGSADIYRVHLDCTGLERLTDDPAFDDQGALSPDGTQLVFVSNRGGHANLWLLNVATKKVSQLTKHTNGDFRPSWSPDGKWITFATARGGFKDEAALHPYNGQPYGQIYVMRADGSDVRQLSADQFEEATPSFVPFPKHK